ncbi:hypothetical protein GPA10_07690 [Streptomyces sp. p1417]|uniref:Uncharacterized protein n=1 Tax=Streptomyces typhae TaxID=2681492 RepID=A0A6L6WQW1_9ACTN|nr:hypothetical protein [Streptomyces typhae]MVO84652.1 hypothetical protein [Streptomyces typhae]
MTATTNQPRSRVEELERIYRAHLTACPRQHFGILTDCAKGLRLRRALHATRATADKGAP